MHFTALRYACDVLVVARPNHARLTALECGSPNRLQFESMLAHRKNVSVVKTIEIGVFDCDFVFLAHIESKLASLGVYYDSRYAVVDRKNSAYYRRTLYGVIIVRNTEFRKRI